VYSLFVRRSTCCWYYDHLQLNKELLLRVSTVLLWVICTSEANSVTREPVRVNAYEWIELSMSLV
jgi:hypothetical protein